MDIYRPMQKSTGVPIVFYIHGGAFRSLSKDTHWVMGRNFAQAGYLVVSINYRLAPKDPYPAAIEDVCAAWQWMLENIESYGGDLSRIAIAGESAGANLTMALAFCLLSRRSEPWAQRVYDAGVTPSVLLPACGIFQVSHPKRFPKRGLVSRLNFYNVLDLQLCYLPEPEPMTLADPVCLFENCTLSRSLPPAFLCVGTWDPLLGDTQQMASVLRQKGGFVAERYYEHEIHAFHALIFRKKARQCWREMIDFADQYLKP
ncbi:MAG: alpha/beta hydrolase [Myxococcota bacterium]|nr:alpha/beta hydrolase [Myxococcota bacterium]